MGAPPSTCSLHQALSLYSSLEALPRPRHRPPVHISPRENKMHASKFMSSAALLARQGVRRAQTHAMRAGNPVSHAAIPHAGYKWQQLGACVGIMGAGWVATRPMIVNPFIAKIKALNKTDTS